MNTLLSTQDRLVTLYYREGASDKVYQATIEPQGELFVVNFAFGRRGTTLQTGTKTPSPVDHGTATRVFTKLVSEKKAKGYTETQDGTPYQHSTKEFSGILPQLLNPIEEEEVHRLLHDQDYCAQEKYDGCRVLVRKEGQDVTGINRKGLVMGLPLPIVHAAKAIPGDFIFDGESVGDSFYVFDVLQTDEEDRRPRSYSSRYLTLLNLMARAMQRNIVLVETAFTPDRKSALLRDLRAQNKEGIVFKRLDASYTPGRPNSGGAQLKHKFYATLSAVVSKINDQRSVEIRLLNGEGWIPCGNVTIPANRNLPEVGQVIEVRYLYGFRESHALFQPVYLGLRKDVAPLECILAQIKYKNEEEP